MDFPKSVSGVGLVAGRFVDENPATLTPGSLIPAGWGNAVTDEILNVVQAAGLAPSEADNGQLLKAIKRLRGGVDVGQWAFSTALAGAVTAGKVALNNANPALATVLTIAEVSGEALDYSQVFGLLRKGDTLTLITRDTAGISHRFKVTGEQVDAGGYRTFPVEYVAGAGGLPAVDAVFSVLFTQAGAAGDSVPLFSVQWWPQRSAIPAGYAPADGQALPRATWPDAWAGIQAGNVPTVAEATWQSTAAERGKYTAGDGVATFRLPDYNGKAAGSLGAVFLRGDGALSAVVAGAIQQDSLQNITGTVSSDIGSGATGAFSWSSSAATKSGGATAYGTTTFDASRVARTSSETRPLNVTGCWIVKLAGAVINPGSADAAQLATDYAALAALVGSGPKLTKEYVSPNQAMVAGGLITLTHNLGTVPKSVTLEYVCTVAVEGYSVGDVIDFSNLTYIHTAANTNGFNITKTAMQLLIRVGANGPAFITNKTTGAAVALGNIAPNFQLVARAMA